MISKGSGAVQGNLVDIYQREIYFAEIQFREGAIHAIERLGPFRQEQPFLLPGFVDAHIHIESSMLTPYEFAKKALVHGTIATISDPHEIANVCGMEGIMYMIENAKEAGLKCCFGAPSCVPATAFETAGDIITANDIEQLLKRPDILYLSEMMNYPGVLYKDPEVMEKIAIAHRLEKPIDGHAPGLIGEQAIQYIQAGISTDHECFTLEEALHKVENGMKILIREGSAARNFDALHPLIKSHPDRVMFCSDDKHPDELMHGHINMVVKRAIALGYDLFDVLRCASLNPIQHYKMPAGCLRIGDAADFIYVKDLETFEVMATYINGACLAKDGLCALPEKQHSVINQFESNEVSIEELAIDTVPGKIKVIEAIEGQLVTKCHQILTPGGPFHSNTEEDILKLVVVNRYRKSKPAVAMIRNMGIKRGAFASTVAHDSHNIIAVGADDQSLISSINALMQSQGGLCVIDGEETLVLPLPVAGLMSTNSCEVVARSYEALDQKVKAMGCELRAPFMTLSFMALLVIPELKLSDQGLFDGNSFQLVSLQG
ncbi:MAG: adenine deaminase [Bacteroidia bacterium]